MIWMMDNKQRIKKKSQRQWKILKKDFLGLSQTQECKKQTCVLLENVVAGLSWKNGLLRSEGLRVPVDGLRHTFLVEATCSVLKSIMLICLM